MFWHKIIGIILGVLIPLILQHVESGTPDPKIRKNLLGGYDRIAQPYYSGYQAGTTITVPSLNVIHYDIDDEQQTFELHAWIYMTWVDPRLRWTAYSTQDTSGHLHFTKNEIWRPDITLYNTAKPKAMDEFADEAQLLVSSNGTIIWVPPIRFLTNCKMNMIYWPFDVQECHLKLGSWTFHEDEIDIQFGPGDKYSRVKLINYEGQQFPNNTEWVITDYTATRTSKKYSCCQENYVDITYNFKIARKYSTFMYTIIYPVIMISFITVLSFLLSSNHLPRFILSMMNCLIIASYLIYFRTRLPTIDHTPNIVKIFTWNLFVNTMNILIAAVLIGLPQITEKILTLRTIFGRNKSMGDRKRGSTCTENNGGHDEYSEDEATRHHDRTKAIKLDAQNKEAAQPSLVMSRIIELTDPIACGFFTLLTIIILICHLC